MPSGEPRSSIMYDIATQTNGYCSFAMDSEFREVAIDAPLYLYPYLTYSVNPKVLKSGSLILDPMVLPLNTSVHIILAVQDHGPLDSLVKFKLSWDGPSQDCTPSTPTSLLFAYSNDLDPNIVSTVWKSISSYQISPIFYWLANIRFDLAKPEPIFYHSEIGDVTSSVESHLPNRTLRISSSNIGSDVFKILDTFLSNQKVPVCGSKILILLKRYPEETDISDLVKKLRNQHATVTFLASYDSIGSFRPQNIYDLATKTNGFAAFDNDTNFESIIFDIPTFYNPFLIYATNPDVTGWHTLDLPSMEVPADSNYWFSMTMTGYDKTDNLESINLRWDNNMTHQSATLFWSRGDTNGYASGNHLGQKDQLNQSSYYMTLSYIYEDAKWRTLQIRVYTDK
uniref:CUB_2 domain-containing protein n=1 Tax=Caenorhabditis tropicalis TaxID=1561998 RepID=A0A1I7TTU9_9PELO